MRPLVASPLRVRQRPSLVHGPTVPFTTVLEGKSNSTEPHFGGPLVTHCWTPPSGMVIFPGVAHILAVYLPGFA
jgi:hypothetical protein